MAFNKNRKLKDALSSFGVLLRLPSYLGGGVAGGIKFHSAGKFYTPKPLILQLLVTHKCNSRCIMCSMWKDEGYAELSLNEIKNLLANPLFDSVTTVIFTGGEAVLRPDLIEIIRSTLSNLPHIQRLGLITNGLGTSLINKKVKQIRKLPEYKKLKNFNVMLSIDGIGDTHDAIRGIPGAFAHLKETLFTLKKMQDDEIFTLSLNCVVQKSNVPELNQILSFSQKLNLPMNFVPVSISDNKNGKKETLVNNSASEKKISLEGQINTLKLFFKSSKAHKIGAQYLPFWNDYFNIISGRKRKVPCALLYNSITIDSDGTAFICTRDKSLRYCNIKNDDVNNVWFSRYSKKLRNNAKKEICSKCPKSCSTYFALEFEFFYHLRYLIKEAIRRLF